MLILLTILHVIVCLFLIVVVLLQSGKAADLAGAFGGMGSQTAFGPRGSATLLSKATTISAIVFMITSLSLSIMATRGSGGAGKTVLDSTSAPKPSAPAKPAQAPAPAKPGAPGGVPITVTPNGGKPVQVPVPATQGQKTPAPPAQKK